MNNLYSDLLNADMSKRSIIKGAFTQVHDDVLSVCPLTNLVIEKGWWTETQIKLLHGCSAGLEIDIPIVQEVLSTIESEYKLEADEIGLLYASWDEYKGCDFIKFLNRFISEYGVQVS